MIDRVRLCSLILLLCAMGDSSCAQEKPKQMVAGESELHVIAESLSEQEDGISEIFFGGISPPFKPTEYTHLGFKGLKDAPPLPTGFVLFKDLVFQVKTQALVSGSYLTVFRIASADNEAQFKKLNVLHLERDTLSPTNFSWEPATVFPGGWDGRIHYVSQGLYDSVQPDFKSKRLAGITDEFGIFAITLAPESEPERSEPFPKVTLKTTNSPETVEAGELVTHTLTFANEGVSAAAELDFRVVLDPDEYVSATPSQGLCKQKEALNIIVCHLGRLPGNASASITLVTRSHLLTDEDKRKHSTPVEAVFKQAATDFVDVRGQIFSEITTTVVKKKMGNSQPSK